MENELDLPEDYQWAYERVTNMAASAFIDAKIYREKLLKGHGYPNEIFRAAQDARALTIILEIAERLIRKGRKAND